MTNDHLAAQVGVFNHVPGDGREFVVTDPSAAKVHLLLLV